MPTTLAIDGTDNFLSSEHNYDYNSKLDSKYEHHYSTVSNLNC